MSVHGVVPLPDDASMPYWDAAREGRLLIQRCNHCREFQFYPRPFCARCLAPDPEWVQAAGTGHIHTFSVVHRTSDPRFVDQLPYAFAIVRLDEGVRMTANIVDTPFDRLRCELPVRVVFQAVAGGVVVPQFTAIEEGSG
jgi:uncharacterized OB-fold protein